MSINKQLRLAILAITMLSTVCLAIAAFLIFYQSSHDNLKADTSNAMEKSAALIESRIDEIDILTEKAQFFSKSSYDLMTDLKKYSADKEYTSEDFYFSTEEIRGIFRTLIYRIDYINFLAIVLPDGNIISYSNTQKDFLYGYTPLRDQWYQDTLTAQGELHITAIEGSDIILNSDGQQSLFFSRTMYDFYTGELLGTLVVNCEPNFFEFIAKDFPEKVIDFGLTDKASQNQLYSHSSENYQQTETMTTTINRSRQPLLLSTTIDNSEYFRLLMTIFASTGLVLLIVLTSAFFITNRFARQFTKPILSLSERMKHRFSQQPVAEIDTYREKQDEVGTLYREYDHMMQALTQYMQDQLHYEQSLLKSELNVYKNQIDSHFLFNTLESINSIAEVEEIPDISNMTLALSNMFRYASNGFVNEASLADELQNVADYLTIQRIRFQKELDFIVINNTSDMLNAVVPKIILQPLVENAIYHGLNKGGLDGKIRLFISVDKHDLVLRIYDNGIGIDEKQLAVIRQNLREALTQVREKTAHIGLINIEARIKSIYGQSYGLSIFSRSTKETLVEIRLPVVKEENNV